MDANHPPETRAEATSTFEQELSELVTRAFARGAAIEDTWTITTPVSDVPDWSVTIEKQVSNGDRSFEPEFLEE